MTQEEVAKKAGMTQAALHKVIAGKTKSTGKIVDIARVLKTSAESLQYGSGVITYPSDDLKKLPILMWNEVEPFCVGKLSLESIDEGRRTYKIPKQVGSKAFVFEVGESQGYEFSKGDLCAADVEAFPNEQSLVVAREPSSGAIIMGYWSKKGREAHVLPLSDNIPPFPCTRSNLLATVIFKPYNA